MHKDRAYFLAKKRTYAPIVMATCYDCPTAQMEEAAGIDIIFVGDSVGTNVLGYAAKTEVTMADMLHHLRAVRRGVQDAYLLADLPYQSYTTPQLAVANARQLLEQGADGVKLEGGLEQVPVVRAVVEEGMEVWGHLGFTPQTLGTRGRVQGRSLAEAQALIQSACALEQAGVSLLVLELISEPISQLITCCLQIPTIGIGSGRFCDGQVLVVHDLLGVSTGERKLMKRYEHLRERSIEALRSFRDEVQQRLFPTEANAFNKLTEDEVAQLADWVQQGMPAEG